MKAKALALLLSVVSWGGAAQSATEDEVHHTSLFKLITAPAPFEGKTVEVVGYLRPHVLYLFPTRELAEVRDWMSSLIVGDDASASIRSSECPGHFVRITGTVRELDPGTYGLADITEIINAKEGGVCWSKDG